MEDTVNFGQAGLQDYIKWYIIKSSAFVSLIAVKGTFFNRMRIHGRHLLIKSDAPSVIVKGWFQSCRQDCPQLFSSGARTEWHRYRCQLLWLKIWSGPCWDWGCDSLQRNLAVWGIMPRLVTMEADHIGVFCCFPFVCPLFPVKFFWVVFSFSPSWSLFPHLAIEVFCVGPIFLGTSFCLSGGRSSERDRSSSLFLSHSSNCGVATPSARTMSCSDYGSPFSNQVLMNFHLHKILFRLFSI